MRLAKDIFSPAEFWIESQFTPCGSCNGCQDCLETPPISKLLFRPLISSIACEPEIYLIVCISAYLKPQNIRILFRKYGHFPQLWNINPEKDQAEGTLPDDIMEQS
jgi:hypothetical protein